MLKNTKKVLLNYILPNIRDIRFLGLVGFGILVLLTSWSAVRIIEVNYSLQKEIAGLHAKNEIRRLENENLKLKNQYLNTETYLELTARAQFGKGAEGETLILVPKEVALSRVEKLPEYSPKTSSKKDNSPKYIKNLKAWRDFYFNKQSI